MAHKRKQKTPRAVKGKQARLNVRIAIKVLDQIDKLIKEGSYSNRSDFIKSAVKLLLKEEEDRKKYFNKSY
jgi:Arc/MetJ-type ribon-helix-helix transcriptional regulator